VISVAAAIATDGDGRCVHARIAVAGAGPVPVRSHAAEEALIGEELTNGVVEHAAARAAQEGEPSEDIDGPVAYKRRLIRVLVARALRRSVSNQTPSAE
jgi:carbon-monoxide dehydrogenase medium subunit